MKLKLLAAVAAGALGMASSASAATYLSIIDHWDVNGPTLGGPFGEIVIEEVGDGKTLNITATIYDGVWQQSGVNNIFAFNLLDDGATQITENHNSPNVVYSPTSYTHSPWGTFTDHFYINASGKNARVNPLQFTAYNANGLTFAGTGVVPGPGGLVDSLGDGNRFNSNAGGWWFLGHIQPDAGESINVAARDARCIANCPVTGVPEPSTWGLMILGFGGAGYALRQRRRWVSAI